MIGPLLLLTWLYDMNRITHIITLTLTLLSIHLVQAEPVTLTLSQEQDGGDAGRACLYIHQGKAEYRLVQPKESCPSTVTVEAQQSHT